MKFKLFYEQMNQITTDQYYDQLDDHLRQYGYHLGKNIFNPDIGYADPSYKGIYRNDDQIGHIDLKIVGDFLILEKIKSYANYYHEDFGLLSKIYPFHRNQSIKYGLTVKSELVSPKTLGYFKKVFSGDFDIRQVSDMMVAIPKHS